MYEAHIVLIGKPDKNPLHCTSCMPIALLNTDFKILTKMLANGLMSVISQLVFEDQTEFIPDKATDINLRRVYTHIQLGPETTQGEILVFLNLEKDFDSVDWSYMQEVLSRFGFGPIFCQWIAILYHSPVAAGRLNGLVSELFPVARGKCQGYPLSPGLFALLIEPLAAALPASSMVQGIRVGVLEEKTALYADDMVLFLGDHDHSSINSRHFLPILRSQGKLG